MEFIFMLCVGFFLAAMIAMIIALYFDMKGDK